MQRFAWYLRSWGFRQSHRTIGAIVLAVVLPTFLSAEAPGRDQALSGVGFVGGRQQEALDDTEVEVRFEAIDGGARVTLEHRGWEGVAPDVAASKRKIKRWGWANILSWFSEWAFWGSPRRICREPSTS